MPPLEEIDEDLLASSGEFGGFIDEPERRQQRPAGDARRRQAPPPREERRQPPRQPRPQGDEPRPRRPVVAEGDAIGSMPPPPRMPQPPTIRRQDAGTVDEWDDDFGFETDDRRTDRD